jgi:hypothetical protein
MQTKSESRALAPALEEVSTALSLTGRIAFWVQLALVLGCGIPLLLAVSGTNFSKGSNPGIGIGIFWAVCGILVLCFSAYLAFRYGRFGKKLRNPDAKLRPKKADTIQLLRLGAIVGLVGILINLLGAGATLGVLVAKAVSQPPGVAITNPNTIIRALDVFVALANLNGIAAHFVGTVGALWLLERVHRH